MRFLLAALVALGLSVSGQAAELGDDGLHKTEWMRETFKDLQEDFAEAKAEGKRLMLIVEQRGCIYCREMHETTFKDPRVLGMLEETYFPVQINLHGATEIVDMDGEALSEREAARKWRLMFTPTMVFFPTEIDPDKPAIEQAAAVMPGAFKAGTTFDMLTWIAEERYLDQSEEDFQRYHARMIRERSDGNTD